MINTRIPAFLFIILLAPASMLRGQNTYFPDNNFEQALNSLAVAGGGAAVAFSGGSEIGEPPTFPTVT